MSTPEAFAQEWLKDRKAERRLKYIRLGLIVAVGLGYLALGASVTSSNKTEATVEKTPHVAVVDMRGEIAAGGDISIDGVRKHLHDAFGDKTAKAVVLRINSPGGAPVQASLIHDEIMSLKKRNPGKKVIAIGEDYVASGGYFIAMAADSLVVNRSTMTGSIGVVSSSFGFTGLMEKLGVERRAFTAGTAKNGMDPFSPLKEQDLKKYEELLGGIYTHFTEEVLVSRKEKLKAEPAELFTGAVWTGDKAVELGLADELGSLSTVMEELGAKKALVYGPNPNLFQLLAKGIGASAGEVIAKQLAPEVKLPEVR